MPIYADTQLKKNPFGVLHHEHAALREDELHRIPEKKKHLFEFDVDSDDNPWGATENPDDIDRMLMQELGDTLDDIH